MLLIPAIDLKGGQCVQLRQGIMESATVYSADPGAMARHWVEAGARRLHVVDLDGAFAGTPVYRDAVRRIVEAAGTVPGQVGGAVGEMAPAR
ncbi:MAG: 1-(5-phosphoribosyl)-5-((5-phosphoribosylamino)methylideneamino)imidazole-4-carboxamide isomerase, partial [Gammaproteobacteria bacterium]|nr:1-(5-phosphoribosyl)-5-((5-phosphoribosylamino)methylideneamino)imidazole-4-carboxamide isomerase [Gammaproteobacteria bacterium]